MPKITRFPDLGPNWAFIKMDDGSRATTSTESVSVGFFNSKVKLPETFVTDEELLKYVALAQKECDAFMAGMSFKLPKSRASTK